MTRTASMTETRRSLDQLAILRKGERRFRAAAGLSGGGVMLFISRNRRQTALFILDQLRPEQVA